MKGTAHGLYSAHLTSDLTCGESSGWRCRILFSLTVITAVSCKWLWAVTVLPLVKFKWFLTHDHCSLVTSRPMGCTVWEWSIWLVWIFAFASKGTLKAGIWNGPFLVHGLTWVRQGRKKFLFCCNLLLACCSGFFSFLFLKDFFFFKF